MAIAHKSNCLAFAESAAKSVELSRLSRIAYQQWSEENYNDLLDTMRKMQSTAEDVVTLCAGFADDLGAEVVEPHAKPGT